MGQTSRTPACLQLETNAVSNIDDCAHIPVQIHTHVPLWETTVHSETIPLLISRLADFQSLHGRHMTVARPVVQSSICWNARLQPIMHVVVFA